MPHPRTSTVVPVIRALDAFCSPPFRSMTFPTYQRLLDLVSCDGPITAFGAVDGDEPLGLGLARLDVRQAGLAQVLSLFVVPSRRGSGIGTALLSALEARLGRNGVRGLRVGYKAGGAHTKVLERVLAKRGFETPKPVKWLGRGRVTRMLEAPHFHPYAQRAPFRMLSWTAINPGQREALKQEIRVGGWVPPALDPFPYEPYLEPCNSLCMLHGEQVVGWLITQRLLPDCVTYSCSYMHPRWQHRGRIIGLYTEAVKRQHEELPNVPFGTLVVPYMFGSMVQFAARRLAPWADWTGEFWCAEKQIAVSEAVTSPGAAVSLANATAGHA